MLLLKRLTVKADNYYIGKLDTKQLKSFGVYQLKSERGYNMALGGKETTKTHEKGVSILVHWNKNANDTEKVAFDLQEQLSELSGLVIDGIKITAVRLLTNEPVDVGTDTAGVYERVIDMIVYYEK